MTIPVLSIFGVRLISLTDPAWFSRVRASTVMRIVWPTSMPAISVSVDVAVTWTVSVWAMDRRLDVLLARGGSNQIPRLDCYDFTMPETGALISV